MAADCQNECVSCIYFQSLALEWHRLVTSRRVVIHVPSLGYSSQLRSGYMGFERRQNAQIGRLCEIRGLLRCASVLIVTFTMPFLQSVKTLESGYFFGIASKLTALLHFSLRVQKPYNPSGVNFVMMYQHPDTLKQLCPTRGPRRFCAAQFRCSL